MAGELTVGLFWPGRVEIAGAQARLDMPNGNAVVKGRQAGGQRGGGVAMNQHHIRFKRGEDAF